MRELNIHGGSDSSIKIGKDMKIVSKLNNLGV
jgi:hypothetical protein